MQLSRWGNSLAIRVPAGVVEALELAEGDDITIHVLGARDFAIERTPDRAALLARLRAFRGKLPADFRYARDEANGG